MTNSKENVMAVQGKVNTILYSMADQLRGKMDASKYRDYILTSVFYKFISDQVEDAERDFLSEDGAYEEFLEMTEEEKMEVGEIIKEELQFYIPQKYRFSKFAEDIVKDRFKLDEYREAIDKFNSNVSVKSQDKLKDLMSEYDLHSNDLGSTEKEKTLTVKNMLKEISKIDKVIQSNNVKSYDILGGSYEYLLANFASDAGKNGGEFFTPPTLTELASRIAMSDRYFNYNNEDFTVNIYDPTSGSGGLLLEAGKHIPTTVEGLAVTYTGQELNSKTYNLSKMNMLMHNVNLSKINLANGNTLEEPQHLSAKFNTVVSNPPYSAVWNTEGKETDERFASAGALAPKSKADLAFVQHIVYQLDKEGVAVVVLPSGTLFRGGAEEKIRKYLIENLNVVDAVINLSDKMFNGVGIAVSLLVLKNNRGENDDIMFVNNEKEFTIDGKNKVLTPKQMQKVVDVLNERSEVEKFSKPITLQEVADNSFNLSVSRYVDNSEDEDIIDISEVSGKLEELVQESNTVEHTFQNMITGLGVVK